MVQQRLPDGGSGQGREGGGETGEGLTGPPPQSGARLPCLAEGPVFPLKDEFKNLISFICIQMPP